MSQERVEFVKALTDLAGRPLTDFQIDRLIEFADTLDARRLNVIWEMQRHAPKRVAYRDYLAMTLRWWDETRTQEAEMSSTNGLGF